MPFRNALLTDSYAIAVPGLPAQKWQSILRAALTALFCFLLLDSCSGDSDREYAEAWSPDRQHKAALIRVPVKMGFSSEFRFVVEGGDIHISKVIHGTQELNWQASFAEVFWSTDSQLAGFIMSNGYAREVAMNAIDLRSGTYTDFASLLPAVREKMRKTWGPYLDANRDPYEQARQPGKALNAEFLYRSAHAARYVRTQ